MKKLDLKGLKFGRLTVLCQEGRNSFNQIMWKCECECGNVYNVVGAALNSGHTRSCGCIQKEVTVARSITHGQNKRGNPTPEYRSWYQMKSRCTNSKVKEYHNYGGRGISICDRWMNSFENFYLDMGKRPTAKHSLDRYPDKNGNYEPTNCRWATAGQQCRNRRNSKLTEGDALQIRNIGLERTIPQYEIGRRYGISQAAVNAIIKRKTFKDI